MISIIIPARNEEKTLPRTLFTLKRELRLTPYELIVADGMSSDRTVEIAKQFAKVVEEDDASKRCIARGKNMGASVAKGTFLVFLDADSSIPHADAFFAHMLHLFDQDEELLGLTATLKVMPEHETGADRFMFGIVNLLFRLLNNVLRTGGAAGEFQMVRTSAFREIHGFREDLPVGEDNDLFHRLTRRGKTHMVKELTVFHSGRRAHIVGWPKLLSVWILNGVWLFLFNRSFHGEWRSVHDTTRT